MEVENPNVLCIALRNMKMCVSFDREQDQSHLRQLMQQIKERGYVYIDCLLDMNNHHLQMVYMTPSIDSRHLFIE